MTPEQEKELDKSIQELLNIAQKGEEVEKQFDELVDKMNQPLTIHRYAALKPIYMDDIQDAVIAAMKVFSDKGLVDLNDHGSRDIHETLAMVLSDYFGDPFYKNHVAQKEKTDDKPAS